MRSRSTKNTYMYYCRDFSKRVVSNDFFPPKLKLINTLKIFEKFTHAIQCQNISKRCRFSEKFEFFNYFYYDCPQMPFT